MVPICTEWRCTQANEATLTYCYNPVAPAYPIFVHIMRMDDNADAKRILLASPPADWRRQLGRPRITWLSTVEQDLKQHHLTLPEAADLAQNRPLWRMTYGATQSWAAWQKRRRHSYNGRLIEAAYRLSIVSLPISMILNDPDGWDLLNTAWPWKSFKLF